MWCGVLCRATWASLEAQVIWDNFMVVGIVIFAQASLCGSIIEDPFVEKPTTFLTYVVMMAAGRV